MKAILSILLTLIWIAPVLADEKPAQIKVCCFSALPAFPIYDADGERIPDELRVIDDDEVRAFCKELERLGRDDLEMVKNKQQALVTVHFLGEKLYKERGKDIIRGQYGLPYSDAEGSRAVVFGVPSPKSYTKFTSDDIQLLAFRTFAFLITVREIALDARQKKASRK